MFPGHKDHDKLMNVVHYAGIYIVCTMQDKKKERVIEGKLVRDFGKISRPRIVLNH